MTKAESYRRTFRALLAADKPSARAAGRLDRISVGMRVRDVLAIERDEWSRAQMRGAPIPAWPGF